MPDSDQAIAALRNQLDRARRIDQLNIGDSITHNGQTVTVADISIGTTYSGLTFTGAAGGWMGAPDTVFYLAD